VQAVRTGYCTIIVQEQPTARTIALFGINKIREKGERMQKLNFGCGKRFAPGWVNIDFHSVDPLVKRVNLLEGFPFADRSFDVVYSSHVLEHFTPQQAKFLLQEAYRVLKPQGIIRIVVPDLEDLCREYLRVLAQPDSDPEKADRYRWIVIELLDQLVRSETYGEMGKFYLELNQAQTQTKNLDQDQKLKNLRKYVQDRIGEIPNTDPVSLSWSDRFKAFLPKKMGTTLSYAYLRLIAALLPPSLREMVLIQTTIGERHRWMYDTYSLGKLLEQVGFSTVEVTDHQHSNIPQFNDDRLDINPDGSSYKANSIYVEAIRT
jgi:predicted SAM-dependent methyltransferase